MEEMKDDVIDTEEEVNDHVQKMLEVSDADLQSVSGGIGVNYYQIYAALWRKVRVACMNHGYRKATCPKCGALLPKLTFRSKYTEEELKLAQQNLLYCRECRQASRDEEWVINQYNGGKK